MDIHKIVKEFMDSYVDVKDIINTISDEKDKETLTNLLELIKALSTWYEVDLLPVLASLGKEVN